MNEILNNPFKIIYKVKNSVDKYHYFTYIFVGPVPKTIEIILEKIKNMQLLEMFKNISKTDFMIMTNFYGNKWFKLFYNKYHINKFLKSPAEDIAEIEKKFNITLEKKTLSYVHKFTYGFNVNRKLFIHDVLKRKVLYNYIDDSNKKSSFDDDIVIGGENNEEIEDDFDDFLNNNNLENQNDYNDQYNFVEENDNFENLENDNNTDKDLKTMLKEENKFNKEVSEKFEKKDINKIINYVDFDNSYDNDYYDQELYNVYEKKYVYSQYIKHSDTISEIKNKIFRSIKNNKKYGEYAYLMPSRIYLWSEYIFNNEYKQFQLEQDIIKDNKLYEFNIEPLKIINYYNLMTEGKKILDDITVIKSNKLYIEKKSEFILKDRMDFIENNEIYMLDIYNEIGQELAENLQEVQLQNLHKTYIYLFFNGISFDSLKNIITYLNKSDNNIENQTIRNALITDYSNFILKTEIDNLIFKEYEKNKEKINNLIKSFCIIRLQIKTILNSKTIRENNIIDAYTIFNELNANDKFLFIQYTKLNDTTIFKFSEEHLKKYINTEYKGSGQTNISQVIKWFDISQPGLTFKYLYDTTKRPLHIHIDNFGNVNFDIYENCESQYDYSILEKFHNILNNIIIDLNKTGITYQFKLIDLEDLKIKFINCSKCFDFDDTTKKINYNDLSDFIRLFYPYFSIVIDPKKRISQNINSENLGKFGTYLRYKKISNFQNKEKILNTFKKYRKYYDNTQEEIINEVCKEFNLTKEDGEKLFIENLKLFPTVQQMKTLKKINQHTKYKSEGVNVEIQNKDDHYILKYHGVRYREQEEEISNLLKCILFIYKKIYLDNDSKYQYIKEKLKLIDNIAKRKHETWVIEEQNEENKSNIKKIKDLDKDRLHFKPSKGKSPWSRLCQNSGDKIRRQPEVFNNVNQIIKMGYKLNNATGDYERIVKLENGEIKTLKAVKLDNDNEENIYYVCGPENNGEHMYIGFLNKTSPDGKALPCCFKNDILAKRFDKFKKKKLSEQDIYDINYILQATRIIAEDRISILPNLLNYYLNSLQNKKSIIVQHILKKTEPNYYFGLGTNIKNNFLSAISKAINISIPKIVDLVEKNLTEEIFNSLNNGLIKLIYKTKEAYLKKFKNFNGVYDFTKENNKFIAKRLMNADDIIHLFTIPGILTENGLNIIQFEKFNNENDINDKNIVSDNNLNMNFVLKYVNNEEYYTIDEKRTNILLFYNNYQYVIIARIEKNDKELIMKTTYDYNDEIINYIKPFYLNNINVIDNIYKDLNGKIIYQNLLKNKYDIDCQILNTMNKTIFYIINVDKTQLIIPCIPSGSIYNLKFYYETDEDNYFKKHITTYETIKNNIMVYDKLGLIFVGFYYYKLKNNEYYVKELIFTNKECKISIPIKKIKIHQKDKDKMEKFVFVYKQYYKKIDELIAKYPNINITTDDRYKFIKYENYKNESYQVFRYHISYILSKNKEIKDKILECIKTDETIDNIRYLIYSVIENDQLHKFYKKMKKQEIEENKKITKLPIVIFNLKDKEKELNEFDLKKYNNRKLCMMNKHCDLIYCKLNKDERCVFSITFDLLIDFINRICYELLNNGIKKSELLNEEGYSVSDVINSNIYKLKEGQKLLRKTKDINNVFVNFIKETKGEYINNYNDEDLDAYNMISYKTKRKIEKINAIIERNKGKKINGILYQPIFEQSDTILRAYANCLFWLKNKKTNNKKKNFGYYSMEQDKYIDFLKSSLIDSIIDISIKENFNDYDLITNISKNTNNVSYLDLLKYLSLLFNYKIIILNVYDQITEIIQKGKIKKTIVDFDKNKYEDNIIIKINNYENKNIEACMI
jgi:hypothetical protein